jgi:ubiquinone/menaquinone biosynthesis C-methylase UbiE
MNKKLVQEQFGAGAAGYATSKVHAKGASLNRLVELVRPQPSWRALDVATAAGHTALAFAPHVSHVVATDLTAEMVQLAAEMAAERGAHNVSVETADAEQLPFDEGSFDLVTCRIAAHHFPDVPQFVRESARVLRAGGILAVVDNVVPGSNRRGKKGEQQRQAGVYVNAFEKLRDPSHHRCLPLAEWQDLFTDAGFILWHQETLGKEMEFGPWATRMRVSPDNRTRLKAMLKQAPEAVAAFLTPCFTEDKITFRLTEGLLIGRLPTEE